MIRLAGSEKDSRSSRWANGWATAAWTPWLARLLPLLVILLAASAFRLYDLQSLPPGLSHDEAVNGLDILVTIPASHPAFFTANNGREPFFIYFQSLFVASLGPTITALRLPSVVIGVATVLATYWLAAEWFDRRVATIAGLGLAVSQWHVDLSRVGLRAIAIPLFTALMLVFLTRALRRGRIVDYALAGASLGLAFDSYISGRLLPLILIAFLALALLRGQRPTLRGLLALGLAAAIVTAPLAVYFAAHPDDFAGRSGQVSVFNPNPVIEGKASTPRENALNTLGMFFVHGDDNARHNLPGRPIFDPVSAIGFVAGLLLVARRALDLRRTTRKDRADHWIASSVLLVWTLAFLALGAITQESPNFLRLTGLAPAVYMVWGLGIVESVRLAARLLPDRRAVGVALAVAALAFPVAAAAGTARDYFGVWGALPETRLAFDSELAQVAEQLDRASAGSEVVSYIDRSPVVQYLSVGARGSRRFWQSGDLLWLPKTAGDVVYVVATGPSGDAARRVFAGVPPAVEAGSADGKASAAIYRFGAADFARLATPRTPVGQRLSGEPGSVELVGYTLDSTTAEQGEITRLTLYWRQLTDVDAHMAPYLHVEDQTGRSWGQSDSLGYAIGGWKAGDVYLSRHEWRVPVDAPPMDYHLKVGMSVRERGDQPGAPVPLGSPLDLGVVQVATVGALPSGIPMPAIGHAVGVEFAGVRLLGYDQSTTMAKPGASVGVDLLWQAAAKPTRDLLFDLAFVDSSGRGWTAASGRPVAGKSPTVTWPAGALLRDVRALVVPGDITTGTLQIRLRARDALSGDLLGEVFLGNIDVVAPPREFVVPSVQNRTDADFAGEIALRGFDLSAAALKPGGTLDLTLYWQASGKPKRDYTVFTHLLDSSNKVVAQQDSRPARGESPTLGWATGQVIRDEYSLRLPDDAVPGNLAIEVGLYDASSGERLRIAGGGADHLILATLPVAGR